MKNFSNFRERKTTPNKNLPKIPNQKLNFQRERAISFNKTYEKSLNLIWAFDYESPLRDFAEEIREKHQERFKKNELLEKSRIYQIRKNNFDLFSNRFEDYYLKKDRKFMNSYHNKYIRDHINEIIDQKEHFRYISQEKEKFYKEEDENYEKVSLMKSFSRK